MRKFVSIAREIIPPLLYASHKGEAGRVCIVGGCEMYTGAPYYAAMSSLKIGGDLSYILCTEKASTIKAYSPEVMVLPILNENGNGLDDRFNGIDSTVSRSHSLVIGPGLGRDKDTFSDVKHIIGEAKRRNLGMVIDGDGLFFVCQNIDLVIGNKKVVLTPNVREYERLQKVLFKKGDDYFNENEEDQLFLLCIELGNVNIVKKGPIDMICNGKTLLRCSGISKPSPRRCGGQGDVVAGALGTMLWWAEKASKNNVFPLDEKKKSIEDNYLLASFLSCFVIREAAASAFQSKKRSTTTPDIIEEISETFERYFPFCEVDNHPSDFDIIKRRE